MNRSRRLRLMDLSRVLRSRVTRSAYWGLSIALLAVIAATIANAWATGSELSLSTVAAAQAGSPTLWVLDSMPLVFLVWGQYVGVILSNEAGAMVLDETEELRGDNAVLAAEARRSLRTDALTGLMNRSHFLATVEAGIEAAQREGTGLGLIVIDLDGFSEINQRYGSASGDRVLLSVAWRLSDALPDDATLARLHSDTFGVALSGLRSKSELEGLAPVLRDAMAPACALDGLSLALAASAGGARYPDNAIDAHTLLDAAGEAMHQVKMRGDDFGLLWSRRVVEGISMSSLSSELRRAIEADELLLHFQPVLDVATGTVTGFETLVRWDHPRRGLVMPDEFIARAERSGLMHELSLWVLKHAIAEAAAWRRADWRLTVSVNLSARSLLRPAFPDVLRELLDRAGVPPDMLILEITENTLMADQARTLEVVERLAAMHIGISIDDFGTGYSQLAYLKRLPVAEIKIDRSFIKDMRTSETDFSIVEATIGLAHALNLRAVAEGVDRPEHLVRLRELGCDLMQGFYLGRPMPGDQVLEWLTSESGALAFRKSPG